MKDKDGFTVPCKHTEWRIIDERDNHDFVCMNYGGGITGQYFCYGDEKCKYYKPDVKERK